MNKILAILLCGVLVIGAAFLFRQQISTTLLKSDDMKIRKDDPHARLMDNNQFYQEAENLLADGGDANRAIELYQQALYVTTDPEERGQIQIKIAATGVRVDTDGSIGQLKVLIADSTQSDIQRAYAAQQLGQTYYKNTNKDIVKSIFSGEPYASFNVEGDTKLALRRLFEYASSFYPLAISELRVARWYADEVYTLKQKKTLTQDEQIRLDSYLSIVREKLTLAEVDVGRTKNTPNASKLIPEALVRKAELLGRMSLAGEELATDPEEAFREAISANIPIRGDGPPRVGYASYLATKYGELKKSDIISVLMPLTSNIKNYPEGVKIYLGAERDNVLGSKKNFIYIASIAPNFKELLLSLGWSEKDFAL